MDEAVHWLVLMHSGHFTKADAQRCEQWRHQSGEHQRVWEQAEQLRRKFSSVPAQVGVPVLGRHRAMRDRRDTLKTLAAALVIPSALWAGYRTLPWQTLTAQYRTGTGERRNVLLADGSRMAINTSSAADVEFDATQRVIRHFEGEILIQTAPDANRGGSRPFIVQTAQGRLRALGTRFIVRQSQTQTRLTVLDGRVEVNPAEASHKPFIVPSQRQVTFGPEMIGAIEVVRQGAGEWARGILYAHEMRLADFVAELARYRPGILSCSPTAADVRVSGVFQLDDTDQILKVLAQTLPVHITFLTRYWVTINAR